MAKQARLQGLIVGSRREQADMVRAIEATGFRPSIDRSFGLAEIADAFRYQESGAHFGKIAWSSSLWAPGGSGRPRARAPASRPRRYRG